MKKNSFKKAYVIYVLMLAVFVIAAVLYVNSLLHRYENSTPEQIVKNVAVELAADAANGMLFEKYLLPEVTPGRFEEHLDVMQVYLKQYTEGEITITKTSDAVGEDVLSYAVESDGNVIAKVMLRAHGPAETKLAVLSFREWQVESVEPILEQKDYTISVPTDFSVKANGVEVEYSDGTVKGDEITYTIKDVYLEPSFEIGDGNGNTVSYAVDKQKVLAEFYYYTLMLPTSLTVTLDGEILQGEKGEPYLTRYDIEQLSKPEILIEDLYGNTVNYEGNNDLPLTCVTLTADSRLAVTVAGQEVPEAAVSVSDNPAYEAFAGYVENLPKIKVYDIAVLENDAEILVTDENGNQVAFDASAKVVDLTNVYRDIAAVPEEVNTEVDVLDAAQTWSLFMSNDMAFAKVEPHLIKDSYQYQVALQYAKGVDITFTSAHTLANPAFTDCVVTNFTWITDDCFAVDISFVKHMILSYGARVDDPMNDRFYFVKYDDTDDGADNPMWKIASMKEIVNNDEKDR